MARNALTAEIELMQLTAQASGTYIEVGWGLTILFINLLISLLLIFLGGPSQGNFARWILLIGSIVGFFFLISGFLRLRKTLKQPSAASPDQPTNQPRALPLRNTPALPAPPASVTEGTTELINAAPPVPVSAKVRDTDSME